MYQGGIFLLRKLRANPLWQDKPFTKGQAWVDMLLQANHKDAEVFYKGEIYMVHRGQFIKTERDLAGDWGWSRSKVTRFLKLLKKCSMIVTKPAPKANRITILNYNELQQMRTKKRTKREPNVNLNKNDKNDKKTYMSDFDLFWGAYPRKVNKQNAFKAWQKCNSDKPAISDLLNIIENHKQSDAWKKDGGQFIPHPTTWLNGKRWEDEISKISQDDDPPYWSND